MLTTRDNPYNYFTQFDEWYSWDTAQGYNTLSLLARVTKTSDDFPTQMEEADITDAVDEILRENVAGVYIKVLEPKKDEVPSE